ncbi:MAG: ADP-forming succinate--CoA ligase subunit beta [Alphaproteobacteria bacterium]|jgi:succinyl-CoA synthetase beta subunit|nr:ADP-forming succinate--CoA ligase subunit beta [Rhodospirillaceae bacterium]MDP6023084.1 ADP-forming succinate--CoA ligase subunit beta [Alphaproteobacteria bacterium]MDP7054635.1 ADP-forming succinate--CoA ligase subunit beta [Alphaproteobacteria bacterium]MDP7228595.1 ADP-forming succinate--CoA ligase subunit beta [Alphaproteobacteria bacterium]MDP7462554.1 ADP-forming succinate--CoA ligase subunit beta [Alphaproteobacteria bacterium]|tara:strand:- start:221 stop:1390 length:1170 start_codon:yes stop_codon:yes gene_type:complete
MNIHEHQAKGVLQRYGVSVPDGGVAYSVDEAVKVARSLPGPIWVVKAQIHAGGRGKGGGVKIAKSIDEVRGLASDILGMTLVTHQTGPAGKEVKRLYIEDGCDIARELYLSAVMDRGTSRIAIMASTEGGMDIEAVAADTPEKIQTLVIDPISGLQGHHARRLAFSLGLKGKQVGSAVKLITALYKAFVDTDASLVEINPLVVTGTGEVMALDAKMNFDDNALYRHADIEELRDADEEDPAELEAAKADLNYIKLDGEIGCMVNGAGLAMATMDIIKLHGGEPANFLDVGGGATKERVTQAFKIILSDSNVKGILVNIFGGIMRCDIIAEGVVAAAREVHLDKPLVVRLEGTNVEKGKKIMASAGLTIIAADDLGDAAAKVVAAVKEAA